MTSKLGPRSMSRRAAVLSVVAIAVALATLVAVFVAREGGSVRRERLADVDTVARLKADTVSRWRSERLAHVAEIAGSPFFSRAVRAVVAGQDGGSGSDVLRRLESTRELFADRAALLVSPAGEVILGTGTASTLDEVGRAEVSRAVQTRAPLVGDFVRAEVDGPIVVDAVAPVLGERGEPIAVLVIQTDPQTYLYPLIQTWPRASDTAETLLAERRGDEVLFLNPLRFAPDAALSLRIPVARADLPASRGARGLDGTVEGRDYRGVEVLAAVRAIPGSPWFIVAKEDRSEALADMRSLGMALILGAALLIGLAAAAIGFVYKAQGKAMFRALYRAEEERRQALEEFKTTLESIGDAVISTDEAGRVRIMNSVAERLTGWSQSEAAGRSLAEVFRIVNEQTRQRVDDPVAEVLREGIVVGLANHTILIARDGTERPIADSGAPIRDDAGRIRGVVLVFRDQTVEREAQRQTLLLTTAIRASMDEIYLFEPDTLRFRFANDSALKNLGYSADEIMGLTPVDLKPEFSEESFAALVGRLRSGAVPSVAFATLHRRADGTTYPVEVHLQLVRHLGDEVFLAVIQDITERVRGEEALQRLNRALRTVSACNQDLFRATDELELVTRICNDIVEVGGHRMAWVGFAENDAAKTIRPVASAGAAEGYLDDVRITWGDDEHGRGPGGTAIRERRAVVVADVDGDATFAPWRDAAVARGYASVLALPLIVHDTPLGVLAIYGARVGAFDDAEIALFEELANDTAFGLRALRDRSRRRHAEAELAASEERYRTLFEGAPVGVFRTTSDGRALLVNPMMARILGAGSPEDAVRRYTDLASQLYADPARRAEFLAALLRDGAVEDFEYEARRADGSSIWIRMSARIADPSDDGSFVINGFATDVTERKAAEAESAASRKMLQAVSDGVPLMICVTDAERHVVSVNRAFAEATGWPRTGMGAGRAGGVLGCVNAGDDPKGCGFGERCQTCRLREAIADTLERGEPRRDVECQMTLMRQGRREEATLLASTTPIDDAGERRVVLCLHDITERKHLELQLRQAQKMEAVGTLAGGIAHDFNNILQAMLASAQVARLEGTVESVTHAVEELETEVQRGASLTRQLLLFARRLPAEHRPVDLTALVAEHARMLKRLLPEDISVAIESDDGRYVVEGDAAQLGQVLINLAINARDAMPDGGLLSLRLLREDERVVLTVSDSGLGIDEKTREHLFEPFFTTKSAGKGTGLGLAVVWGIVKDHGGSIEVESEPGQGSTFRVCLPAAERIEDSPVRDESALPRGGGRSVLLVEDNDIVRRSVARQLEMLGYAVTDVGSGEEALELGAEPAFDVVLTDYRLTGMTGLELVRGLRGRWPEVRVVLMSGYAPEDLDSELAGAIFVQKPFTIETLARSLATAASASPPARS